jgi:carbon storage regulator CsrA
MEVRMLLMVRKEKDIITIDEDVKIHILKTRGGSVKVGIQAPNTVRIGFSPRKAPKKPFKQALTS